MDKLQKGIMIEKVESYNSIFKLYNSFPSDLTLDDAAQLLFNIGEVINMTTDNIEVLKEKYGKSTS